MSNEEEFETLVDTSKGEVIDARVKVRKCHDEELVRKQAEEDFKLVTFAKRLAVKKFRKNWIFVNKSWL